MLKFILDFFRKSRKVYATSENICGDWAEGYKDIVANRRH